MSSAPLEAARALGPLIRASAAETDAQRELPRPLFEAMADAGLFQLGLPRAIGGGELDLPSYIQVIEEIGQGDASTGWVTNQVAIFATYAARMPHAAARAIWIDTPRSVVANTPMASAQALVVPGGYRVTGRQGFSTGCRHASWLAAHATVIEQGRPRLDEGQPEQRYCFVPARPGRAARHLARARHAGDRHPPLRGGRRLRARGAHRALDDRAAGRDGPLYQIPRTLVFASGDAAVALGTARSCLATFVELATTKTPRAMDGPAARPGDGAERGRPRGGGAALGSGVPHRGGGRRLERGDPREGSPSSSARTCGWPPPTASAWRSAWWTRSTTWRGPPRPTRQRDPAPLPGRPRDQPAPAGAPGSLRAGGPPLARAQGRRDPAVASTARLRPARCPPGRPLATPASAEGWAASAECPGPRSGAPPRPSGRWPRLSS